VIVLLEMLDMLEAAEIDVEIERVQDLSCALENAGYCPRHESVGWQP